MFKNMKNLSKRYIREKKKVGERITEFELLDHFILYFKV